MNLEHKDCPSQAVSRALFLFLTILTSGCSSEKNERAVEKYLTTFDHIHTDQYIWTYGSGGIYWVSDQYVILQAQIENAEGKLDRGIYQVDVTTGSHKKVVDVPDEESFYYKYCFDGEILHVLTEKGEFSETGLAAGYSVNIRDLAKSSNSRKYSSFRCKVVSNPSQEPGYSALRLGDGFLKFMYTEPLKREVFLANERGEVIKKLTEQYLERKGNAVGLFTLKKLIEDKDSYFGYSPWDRNNCTKLWWLDRKQWSVSSRELCLSDLSLGSLLVHNIKQAHYVEHYTMRSSKSYILIGDEKIEVEGGIGRGAASSPDGCKIAYGVGDKKKHQAPVRQNLKVFNYCEYVSKEGEILWKDLNL